MRLVSSAGATDVLPGQRFEADGCVWEIIGLTGERIYSPSGFGGTPTLNCRLISGEPDNRFTPHMKDGECEWCGDSVALHIITNRGEAPWQKARRSAEDAR